MHLDSVPIGWDDEQTARENGMHLWNNDPMTRAVVRSLSQGTSAPMERLNHNGTWPLRAANASLLYELAWRDWPGRAPVMAWLVANGARLDYQDEDGRNAQDVLVAQDPRERQALLQILNTKT